MDLVAAFDYYDEHGFIMFWNPRDITDQNLARDLPDVEALLIEPPSISSAEAHEGQYLVEDGKLEPYQSYRGHEGIDKIFKAVKRAGPGFQEMATAAIKQCVDLGWEIMEVTSGEDGTFFKRYVPISETPAATPVQSVSHTRTLTFGETFQRRTRGETAVPFIRLSGRWLAEAGFHVGASIRVSAVKNRVLVITARSAVTYNLQTQKCSESNLFNKFE
jgi:hypothetical protein